MVSNKWIWDLMSDTEVSRKLCHYCGTSITDSDNNYASTLACNGCFRDKFEYRPEPDKKKVKVKPKAIRKKKEKTSAL